MVVANRAHAHPKVYQYPGHQRQPWEGQKAQKRPLVNTRLLRRILAGVFVVALALLVVFRYGQISHVNMEINRLSNTRAAVVDEQRHLGISIAQLTALDRLERIAVGELGMQYPHPDQIRFVGYNISESGDGDGE